MIIKGGSVGSVAYWSKHLMRDDTNTRAELKDVRGLLADDVGAALRQMEAVASGSRSQGDFMYQANINPRDHERLTDEQWQQAVDTLEKNLGLEGHQRIVVEHEKEDRVHRHVVWNRVDADTMRIADMSWNYYTHERTSRELEERFDLARTKSLHGEHRPDGRPERAPEMWEERAKERGGIDRDAMKAELTELWRATDSGKAFQSAIEEQGYMLARGDRRNFVVMDQAGTAHSLARRLDGVTTAQVSRRMADIDRDSLPSVVEARARQKAHDPNHYGRDAAGQVWEDRLNAVGIEKGGQQERAEQRAAWVTAKTAERQAQQPLTKIEKEVLSAQQNTAARPWALEVDLRNRGIIIARVDAEGREKMEADRRAAFQEDKTRHVPRVQDGELVAVNRFGDVHRLNPQKLDLKAIEANLTRGAKDIPGLGAAKERIDEDRAAAWKERADKEARRIAERDARHRQRELDRVARIDARDRRMDEAQQQAATRRHTRNALEVADAGGKVLGKLADVIGGLFGGGSSAPPPAPEYVSQAERMREGRRAEAALYRIRESVERGERLRAEDLRNLTPTHIENIRAKGDDYLRGLIDRMDDDRRRERDDGRTRDR